MSKNALIKEIFTSIQGEGPYIGANQLFIRFSGCNLKCAYCDTEHELEATCYTPLSLQAELSKYDFSKIHSISLTGGEPLLHSSFLEDFLPQCESKIYLETNGTLLEPLAQIARYIDIASIDIKLNSVSNQGNLFITHDKFIEMSKNNNIETFVKVVFDDNIEQEEIETTCKICKDHGVLLVLQPMMLGNKLSISGDNIQKIYNKFLNLYSNVRVIPQTHKFLQVE